MFSRRKVIMVASVALPNLGVDAANQTRDAALFEGDWGARIQAAHDDLPTGGVVDGRRLRGCPFEGRPIILDGVREAHVISVNSASELRIKANPGITGTCVYSRAPL